MGKLCLFSMYGKNVYSENFDEEAFKDGISYKDLMVLREEILDAIGRGVYSFDCDELRDKCAHIIEYILYGENNVHSSKNKVQITKINGIPIYSEKVNIKSMEHFTPTIAEILRKEYFNIIGIYSISEQSSIDSWNDCLRDICQRYRSDKEYDTNEVNNKSLLEEKNIFNNETGDKEQIFDTIEIICGVYEDYSNITYKLDVFHFNDIKSASDIDGIKKVINKLLDTTYISMHNKKIDRLFDLETIFYHYYDSIRRFLLDKRRYINTTSSYIQLPVVIIGQDLNSCAKISSGININSLIYKPKDDVIKYIDTIISDFKEKVTGGSYNFYNPNIIVEALTN